MTLGFAAGFCVGIIFTAAIMVIGSIVGLLILSEPTLVGWPR